MGAQRRVAVTGLGAVSAFGPGVAALREGAWSGRSAIAPVSLFDASRFVARTAAEVRVVPVDPDGETQDRTALLALAAAAEALAGAAFGGAGSGVAVGTTLAGREEWGRGLGVGSAAPRALVPGRARGSPRAPTRRGRPRRHGLDGLRLGHGGHRPRGGLDPRRPRDARPRGRRRRALGVRVLGLRRAARPEPDGRATLRRGARRPHARRRGGFPPSRGRGGRPPARRRRPRAHHGLRLVRGRLPHDAPRPARRRPHPRRRSPPCATRDAPPPTWAS